MTSSLLSRVGAFEEVRDIPFRASESVAGGGGCMDCVQKTEALNQKLKRLGLKTRDLSVSYKWEQLDLPSDILAIPHDSLEYHFFLEVLVPEKNIWVIVDPTWDSGLSKLFEIAKWDGLSNTSCATPHKKQFSVEETKTIKMEALQDVEYYERNAQFLKALDELFERVRREG